MQVSAESAHSESANARRKDWFPQLETWLELPPAYGFFTHGVDGLGALSPTGDVAILRHQKAAIHCIVLIVIRAISYPCWKLLAAYPDDVALQLLLRSSAFSFDDTRLPCKSARV
jgi:hypothetical protein